MENNTTIAFIDSGIGGLIFACESIIAMQEIPHKIQNNHLSFLHIGDTKNVPYGLKTPSQLIILIQNLLEECKKLGATIVVIACNTAATVLDEEFLNTYRQQGMEIILIINKSAEALYNSTPVINNEKHILVLGTRQTILSNKYKEALLLCDKLSHNGNKLFIHQYSPIRWEHEIEKGIKRNEIQIMVNEDLSLFKHEIGKDFEKITSVGLFCTHYPYFKNEIHQYFSQNTQIGDKIQLASQGAIFAEVIAHEVNKVNGLDAVKHFKQNNESDGKILINSYITGDEIAPIQTAISNIYPEIPVIFHKI